ncbi:related to Nucleoporin NUP120 [Nakaseomyces glabratus]|nr:hypothetical protein J6894_02562 [Nakaseomyces glabratus]QNG14642.1 uncharacterized protein GWK60_I00847 [Nakaseomyces glabratus]SCV15843.1 related to Nucleoporin NUP120 [Nakaseomyces glabratus]SLM15392.1 related to Nucleoporin NUP120 [Nakaseomyces glabratus]
MAQLAKIDLDLLQICQGNGEFVHLLENSKGSPESFASAYSQSMRLTNGEFLCYHISTDYKSISFYNFKNASDGRTIIIHLPAKLMHEHHTLVVEEQEGVIVVDVILESSAFLTMRLPLEYIFGIENVLDDNWLSMQSPYDFTVRRPHLLHKVSQDFFVVFLEDGGLLGLRQHNENYLEPLLFNDYSYIQTLTSMFSRKKKQPADRAVACLVIHDKYLVVLTRLCHLKIWDLGSFHLVQEYNLTENFNGTLETIEYESNGNYISTLNDVIVIYLPIGNGVFKFGRLSFTNDGERKPTFNMFSSIDANMKKSTIWSFVDMKLTDPLELNFTSTTFNLIILWKSGSNSKLQILNIKDSSFSDFEWIEASNKSLQNIQTEEISALIQNYDFDKALYKLKSHYSDMTFKEADSLLLANNIVYSENNETQQQQYLANLDTLLRDINNNHSEIASFTIYKNDMILVNTHNLYNHGFYKINSSLENIYFNLSEITDNDDQFAKYFKLLNLFFSTISRDAILSTSDKFIDIAIRKHEHSTNISTAFSQIFNECLKSKFEKNNVKTLFAELATYDIVEILNELIENHLKDTSYHLDNFVEAFTGNVMNSSIIIENLYHQIVVQNKLLQLVLLSFLFLDFDTNIFGDKIETLLDINYKQTFFLSFYEFDSKLTQSSMSMHTLQYPHGVQIFSSSELAGYLEFEIATLYSTPIVDSRLYIAFMQEYVLNWREKMEPPQKAINFFKYILEPLYRRNKIDEEFLLAMSMFNCGRFEQAYEFFTMNDYMLHLANKLPPFLKNVQQNSLWYELLKTFTESSTNAHYYLQLSLLFKTYNRLDLALKCVSKSVEYSMKHPSVEEAPEFSKTQHLAYLDLLVEFKMYEEVIDVLRMSQMVLDKSTRKECFYKLLSNSCHGPNFFTILLKSCNTQEGSKPCLSHRDFVIIDEILINSLKSNKWEDCKKIFTFRLTNNRDREAAEIVYEYLQDLVPQQYQEKQKCYLLILNVLKTFDNVEDQWIIYDGKVKKLIDLKTEFCKLSSAI